MGVCLSKIDLVTVCYTDELRLLELQARSVRRFVDRDGLGQILIIVNERNHKALCSKIRRIVLPEYGTLKSRVKIVPATALTGQPLKRYGWRSQQLLKLLAVTEVRSRCYMVLDCKNHFIRPFSLTSIWHETNRVKTPLNNVVSVFQEDYVTACRYFGVEKYGPGFRVLPSTTPFVFWSGEVQSLIETLEQTEAKGFTDIFMRGPRVTEFYLYLAYLQKKHGGFDKHYVEATRGSFTLMPGLAKNPNELSRRVDNTENDHVFMFGVHRKIIEDDNPQTKVNVFRVWQKARLVSSHKEAEYFWFVKPAPLAQRIISSFKAMFKKSREVTAINVNNAESNTLDLITVCFEDDLPLLKIQARSISIYLEKDLIQSIMLVVNDRNQRRVRKKILKHILPEYGMFKDRVFIYSASEIAESAVHGFGWRSQQALKVAACKKAQAKAVMILDCKAHFIRPLNQRLVWGEQGRLRTIRYPVLEKFRDQFLNACHYFDIDHASSVDNALPTVPPFLVPTAIVKDMIGYVEAREKTPFFDFFMRAKKKYTEFYFIYAFIQARAGGINAHYEQTSWQAISLRKRHVINKDEFYKKQQSILNDEVYCMSVERPILMSGAESRNRIKALWSQYGLVLSEEEFSSTYAEPESILSQVKAFIR